MSAHTSLDRAGLTSLWFTSAELGAGGEIIDWALSVDQSKSTTYVRIDAGPHREVLAQNHLDAFGKPFGLDGLVGYAEFRKEILEAELKSRKIAASVKLTQYTLPKSTIYILGSNARITSIDADDGRQNWSVGFGSLSQPCIGIHADEQFVVAVNGSSVYCFDSETGKQMWSKPCRFAVQAPPVVTQGKVFVPLLDGRLEIFDIANEGFNSYAIVGSGVPTSRPLVTREVVAWPTSLGHLNFTGLSENLQKSLIYRLKAGGRIGSTPIYRDNLVFTGSEDGFVYAIKQDVGALQWQSSVGTPVSQAPFIFGNRVYVVSDDQRMFCLDAHTGALLWDQPVEGIGRYLGASRDRIYMTDGLRTLLAMDPVSGRIVSRAEIGNVNIVLANNESDRLYIANNAGIVHCIHETGHPIPYFHSKKLEAPKAKDPFADGADASTDDLVSEDGDNPFGGDDAGEDKSENQVEEGMSDANPFSNESDDESADPVDEDATSEDGGGFGTDEDDQPADSDPKPDAPAAKVKKSVVWKDVERIFSKNCSKCHDASQAKGGFDFSSYSTIMSHGDTLISPGDGESSHLYRIVNHDDEPSMPPEGKKLSKGNLKKIKQWINDGALETDAAPVEDDSDGVEGDGGDGIGGSDDLDPFG